MSVKKERGRERRKNGVMREYEKRREKEEYRAMKNERKGERRKETKMKDQRERKREKN